MSNANIKRLAFFSCLLLAAIACGCHSESTTVNAEDAPAKLDAQSVQIAAALQDDEKESEKVLADIAKRKVGTDWPHFLGVNRDSKSTETGILTEWPSKGLKVVWEMELGPSYGIGSVAKGRYYQFDRVDDEEVLYCLNAETGRVLWKESYEEQYTDLYGYDSGPRCSPIIDGNRVYTLGVAGKLRCYNATNGELIWYRDTHKEFGVIQNFFGVGSTPAIEGDLLIAMIGGSPAADASLPPGALDQVSGDGSGIVAFDKYSGEVRYKVTDELASYASIQLATIDDQRWGFSFSRGGLIGFSPASGKVHFRYPWRSRTLESVNASTPVIIENQIFISETYGPGSTLLSVKDNEFEIEWQDIERTRDKIMQTHWNTTVHIDGYLYGCSGRHTQNAELRCVELSTGKVMWSVPDLTRCSLTYVDGHFIALGEYGHLFMFKPNPKEFLPVTGDAVKQGDDVLLPLRPTHDLRYPCWAAPVISHGLMYIRGKGSVMCLELIPEKK